MSRVVFYPYKMGSKSCKAIQDAMQAVGHTTLRVYPDRNYKPKDNDLIINWGCSTKPLWGQPDINSPESVAVAANKLKAFEAMGRWGVTHPGYWERKEPVQYYRDLFPEQPIVARLTLTGHGGAGIVIVQPEEELPDAPLYTPYFSKTHEYRVHVFNGEVLDVQEKRKRSGSGGRENEYVWNVSTNFVFCRETLQVPEYIQETAIEAVNALDLTFGAVDIGYNSIENTAVVFEVNTAPGLTGTTLTKYVEKFNEYL